MDFKAKDIFQSVEGEIATPVEWRANLTAVQWSCRPAPSDLILTSKPTVPTLRISKENIRMAFGRSWSMQHCGTSRCHREVVRLQSCSPKEFRIGDNYY